MNPNGTQTSYDRRRVGGGQAEGEKKVGEMRGIGLESKKEKYWCEECEQKKMQVRGTGEKLRDQTRGNQGLGGRDRRGEHLQSARRGRSPKRIGASSRNGLSILFQRKLSMAAA